LPRHLVGVVVLYRTTNYTEAPFEELTSGPFGGRLEFGWQIGVG
jgi:hypothetical protein